MSILSWLLFPSTRTPKSRAKVKVLRLESLEKRDLFAADPLPVLLVIADQQDFYFREYHDTRVSLEAQGLQVVVAATTTNPSYPHPGSGQGWTSGMVTPNVALEQVNQAQYSAIAFVGGWGASQYQYAYNDPNFDGTTDNYYAHQPYNADDNMIDGIIAPQKVIVNNLIAEFLAADKPVAAICHGITVLAWARVDGTSPIAGRHVVVPTTVTAPDQFYNGQWRTNGYLLGQYDQVIDNGGIASPISGNIGNPSTAADDVVVDGRIITAENFDSATLFGTVIAQTVLADLTQPNAQIVAQYVYHAGSSFNQPGNLQNALDTGKQLAIEGASSQQLGFNNLINSTSGIDGLVFDIDNLPGTLTASDFAFQMSPTGAFNEGANPVAGWAAAPAPSAVSVTPGSPSRVAVTWPSNAIANRWLRVTVIANANTGLAANQVYYIGHLLGETTGPSGTVFTVAFADITPIRSAAGSTVNSSSIVDIDKNGTVSFADISAMRSNVGSQLTIITIPASSGGGSLMPMFVGPDLEVETKKRRQKSS